MDLRVVTFVRPLLVVVLVASVLFAGCSAGGPLSGGGGSVPSAEPGAPRQVTIACTNTRLVPFFTAPMCNGPLPAGADTTQEPSVAITPKAPEKFAVAVNQGRLQAPGAAEPSLFIGLYESANGKDWKFSVPPDPGSPRAAGKKASTSDPSVAFTGDGRLHLAGLVTPVSGGTDSDAYYTSTDGTTWSTPKAFTTDGSAGREWLVTDGNQTLYVLWGSQNGSEPGVAAVASHDGGVTWSSVVEGEAARPCQYPTGAVINASLYVACSWPKAPGSRIFRLDEASASFSLVGSFPQWKSVVTYVAAPGRGILMVAAQLGHEDVAFASSRSDGARWAEGSRLRDRMYGDNGVPWLELMAFGAAPGHGVQLLIKSNSTCAALTCGSAADYLRRVTHVALDPRTFNLVSERSFGFGFLSRPVPATGPAFDDGFFGISFGATRSFFAWTREHEIEYGFGLPQR